jgi:phosphatidate cytidylyltransferase
MSAAIILLLADLFRKERTRFIAHSSLSLFGLFFIGFSTSSLVLIRQLPAGANLSILVFLLIWVCDTFAYAIGRVAGRHRLWPQVSPKKTIEGSLAGLIGALAAAYAARRIFLPELSGLDCLLLGSIAGILGQAGDLVESALKRDVGAKDSSHLLPGHGGFLDRFDSFYFTAPSIYYYAKFVLHQ